MDHLLTGTVAPPAPRTAVVVRGARITRSAANRAVGIGAVRQAVAIVVLPICTVRLRRGRRTAIHRAVAWIFARIATPIPAERGGTIDLAVVGILIALTCIVTAAVRRSAAVRSVAAGRAEYLYPFRV